LQSITNAADAGNSVGLPARFSLILTVAKPAPLKDRAPYLYETLTHIVSGVNVRSQRVGIDLWSPVRDLN
jgi:hypothetical protein